MARLLVYICVYLVVQSAISAPTKKMEEKTTHKKIHKKNTGKQDLSVTHAENCDQAVELANETAKLALAVFNGWCDFGEEAYYEKSQCLNHTRSWSKKHCNYSHFSVTNTTDRSLTDILDHLLVGVKAHSLLIDKVSCSFARGFCRSWNKGYTGCPGNYSEHRKSEEQCNMTHPDKVRNRINSLESKLSEILRKLTAHPADPTVSLPEIRGWNSAERQSYRLMAIYNTYRQAAHTQRVMSNLCKRSPTNSIQSPTNIDKSLPDTDPFICDVVQTAPEIDQTAPDVDQTFPDAAQPFADTEQLLIEIDQ